MILSAILARNEVAPDRYLERVIRHCQGFSDAVLLLDDRSTDDTLKIARNLGCITRKRTVLDAPAWGAEAPARQQLWEEALKYAQTLQSAPQRTNAWLLVCDADMLLQGPVEAYTQTWEAAAWAFPLLDLWNDEEHFRIDGPWALGPQTPRPWLFNLSAIPQGWKPVWNQRGIHVGHHPLNWDEIGPTFVADELHWRHLAYVKAEHRQRKFNAYQRVEDQLSPFERQHAHSILDS